MGKQYSPAQFLLILHLQAHAGILVFVSPILSQTLAELAVSVSLSFALRTQQHFIFLLTKEFLHKMLRRTDSDAGFQTHWKTLTLVTFYCVKMSSDSLGRHRVGHVTCRVTWPLLWLPSQMSAMTTALPLLQLQQGGEWKRGSADRRLSFPRAAPAVFHRKIETFLHKSQGICGLCPIYWM